MILCQTEPNRKVIKPSPLLGLSSSKAYAVLVHSLSISTLLRLFSGSRKGGNGVNRDDVLHISAAPTSASDHVLRKPARTLLRYTVRRLVSSYPFAKSPRSLFGRVQASGSGLETSIADATDSSIKLKKAKISVESQTENQIELRVDVIGEETDRVFGQVLTNLARTAPPIPGFRRQKGGKTTKVPRDFLLQVLGEERVTKFVIQEIVTSTVANYVKTENLIVKDNRVSTSQSTEDLESSFNPGNDFGFNAVMELQSVEAQVQAEATSS